MRRSRQEYRASHEHPVCLADALPLGPPRQRGAECRRRGPDGRPVLALVIVLLGLECFRSARASALESELVVGSLSPRPWEELEPSDAVRTAPGWRGLPDLVLRDAAYQPDDSTELLLAFDGSPPEDAAGRYRVTNPGDVTVTAALTAFGEGSGAFDGGAPMLLEPAGPGSEGLLGTSDFSLEFWLYPLHLEEGETILAWSARRPAAAGTVLQGLSCRVRSRRLVWRLEGLFISAEGARAPLELRGLEPLLPERWAHHQLRYDASEGLLEYLVDGSLQAVAYTTSTGREGGSVPTLWGDASGRLAVGERLTGLLDELRIVHRWVERPQLARYSSRLAEVRTRPLDLGYPASRILRIEARLETPGATAIELAYRASDDPFFREADPWQTFEPGRSLDPQARGRFVQMRIGLASDGQLTPRLSWLRVVYEKNLPPPPPARVQALAGAGSVTLAWQRVYEEDIGGYLVYYGTEPGVYLGEGSEGGPSPVDVGDVSSFTLRGLEPGILYYFAIVAYEKTAPHQTSRFSAEVSARPRAPEVPPAGGPGGGGGR